MKGLWTAGEIEKAVGSGRSAEKDHLVAILQILQDHKDGLSNAEMDALLNDSSQWVATWWIRELLAAGFIDYKPQLFGEPGKHTITPSGAEFLRRLGADERETKDTA